MSMTLKKLNYIYKNHSKDYKRIQRLLERLIVGGYRIEKYSNVELIDRGVLEKNSKYIQFLNSIAWLKISAKEMEMFDVCSEIRDCEKGINRILNYKSASINDFLNFQLSKDHTKVITFYPSGKFVDALIIKTIQTHC